MAVYPYCTAIIPFNFKQDWYNPSTEIRLSIEQFGNEILVLKKSDLSYTTSGSGTSTIHTIQATLTPAQTKLISCNTPIMAQFKFFDSTGAVTPSLWKEIPVDYVINKEE